MSSLIRSFLYTCVLILVAGLYAGPALSQQAATEAPVVQVAMTPAPLTAPPLAEPVLL